MPLAVFGKCVTGPPTATIRHAISGAVANGTPFVDFTVTDWDSPDVDWTPPGITYGLRMRVGFPPTSAKDWFFAGRQWKLYNDAADDDLYISATPAIYSAGEHYFLTGPNDQIATVGIQGSAYGFDAIGLAAGDPASSSGISQYIQCNPWVTITPEESLSIPALKVESGNSGAGGVPPFYYSRAFDRDELTIGLFAGVEYLMTATANLYLLSDPCGSLREAPFRIRDAVWKDTDFITDYGSTVEMSSSLLIEIFHDPNYP